MSGSKVESHACRLAAIAHLVLRRFGLLVHGIRDGSDAARRACEAVGLSHRLELPVARLSGQRARVAVARALAANPALLPADEPTSRLDRDGATEIAELLVRLARDQGAAIVCAIHDHSAVERADVSIVLGTNSVLG